ncbi:MAG: response regulator [Flexilinea sp.]
MSKILIIEDNEYNIYLESFILEKNGHQILSALNGEDGIILASKERPDLILLDIQLPIMDGYSVARALRQNHALDKTPIIAVTSYAMVGDRENILTCGCNDYIEKPINPDTFVDQVTSHLNRID